MVVAPAVGGVAVLVALAPLTVLPLVDIPVDIPVAIPVDIPVAIPVDIPVAIPVDIPVAIPVDIPLVEVLVSAVESTVVESSWDVILLIESVALEAESVVPGAMVTGMPVEFSVERGKLLVILTCSLAIE